MIQSPNNNTSLPTNKQPSESGQYDGLNQYFAVGQFDSVIQAQGYDALVEKSVVCPCVNKVSGSALSNCDNCGGYGFVFLKPIITKVMLSRQNKNIKNTKETQIDNGTVFITVQNKDSVSFYDRVTNLQSLSDYTEIVYPELNKFQKYSSWLVYKPLKVTECFLFVAQNKPLKPLVQGIDYTLDGHRITFNDEISVLDTPTISIRYSFNPSYIVIEEQRDISNLSRTDSKGQLVKQAMPTNATAKKVHLMIDTTKTGKQLIRNYQL